MGTVVNYDGKNVRNPISFFPSGAPPPKSDWVVTTNAPYGYDPALFGAPFAADARTTDVGVGFDDDDEDEAAAAAAIVTGSYFMSRAKEEGGRTGDWLQARDGLTARALIHINVF